MSARILRGWRGIGLATLMVVILQAPAYGFGWGIPLPPLPPLPGDIKDDPPPILNDVPPVDPDDPIAIISDDELPPPDPGSPNETPEPATIIAGLLGAGAFGIAGWWRRRRRQVG